MNPLSSAFAPGPRGSPAAPAGARTIARVDSVGTQVPSRPTILIVDDSVDLARTLELALLQAGHAVRTAGGAEAALEILDADDSVDLVLSDIRMPEIDGYSLVRIVRHRHPEVAVLLMSAFPWTAEDVIPHGVTILQKPFDLGTLERAIGELRREASRDRS